jgi:hypothetical protein
MADRWLYSIFKFLSWILKATIVVVVFLFISELMTQSTNTDRWLPGVVLCFLGLSLYLGSVLFSRSYSINRTLAAASIDSKVAARPEPQWVSFVELLGISALIASEILIFIYVFS